MKLHLFLFFSVVSTLLAGSEIAVVQKPADATQYTETSRAHFGIWTDPQSWQPDPHPADIFRLEFTYSRLKMNATVNAEAVVVPFESLPERALKNGRTASTKFNLVSQEHRTVCGKDVWFLIMEGIAGDGPFTSYGYYYSGPEGSVQSVVFLDPKDLEACRGPALDFLNGLQIGRPGAAPTTDRIAARTAAKSALATSSSPPEISPVANVDIKALDAAVPYHPRNAALTRLKEMLIGDPADVAQRLQPAADKKDPLAMYLLGGIYASGRGVPADPARAVELMEGAAAVGLAPAQVALGSWHVSGYLVSKDWQEAARLLSKAAAAGSPDGQERLGEILLSSHPKQAFEFLYKAADQAFAPAEYRLAWCYGNGKGVEKSPELELEWLQRALQHGSIAAAESLGEYYWSRNGTGDRVEAVKYFTIAARGGLPQAQNNLGVCLRYANGIPADLPQSAKWLQKAADQGYATALTNLGKAYAFGLGVPRDLKQAYYWAEKAANAGDAKAQAWMGIACVEGKEIEKNVPAGIAWLRQAAGQNDLEACYNLGIIYGREQEVPQDKAEAAKWFRQAAERGEPKSQDRLAEYYFIGFGVEKDLNEAFKWEKKAAESGMPKAQWALGIYYGNGQGVPKSVSEGIAWIRKAAEQRYSPAEFELGIAYETGTGVAASPEEAVRWFRLAALHGNAKGENAYGYHLATGQGVKQDLVEAYKWYLLAMGQDEDAEPKARAGVNKKAILLQMTPEQIQEGERRAAGFVPEKEHPDKTDLNSSPAM